MSHYTIYSYENHKQVCTILAASFHDAWDYAESRGFDCNNYYIL